MVKSRGRLASMREHSPRKLFVSTGEGSTHCARFFQVQIYFKIIPDSDSCNKREGSRNLPNKKVVVKSDFYLSEREHSPKIQIGPMAHEFDNGLMTI